MTNTSNVTDIGGTSDNLMFDETNDNLTFSDTIAILTVTDENYSNESIHDLYTVSPDLPDWVSTDGLLNCHY